MTTRRNTRDLIVEVLEAEPDLTIPEIAERAIARGALSMASVETLVRKMRFAGVLVRDESVPRHNTYRLSGDERKVAVLAATDCSLPSHVIGTKLDPIGWSMRYLLGA